MYVCMLPMWRAECMCKNAHVSETNKFCWHATDDAGGDKPTALVLLLLPLLPQMLPDQLT
jgi:hypothetical protein